MRRYKTTVTTAADGSATAYIGPISGKIHSVGYLKTDFADGVDFTITTEKGGENVWVEANVNAAKTVYPRAPTHNQVGVANLYAAGGTAVSDKVGMGNDRLKIVIGQGGNVKSGAFQLTVE